MGVRKKEHSCQIAIVVVLSMVGCVFMAMLPTASSADAPSITVLRENFENPGFNCDTGWDQDSREVWIRGDGNANSGVDTWCHSKFRVSPSGDTYSLWCAVIGNSSIAAARGLGSQPNTGSQRYDANMSAYIRHSLSMSPELGDGTLTFIYWSKTMASGVPGGYDHLRVSVSADNITYTTIWTQPSADEASWRQVIVTVPSNARTISFDFISGSYSGAEWQEGAYIDNILVTQVSDPSWSFVKTLPRFSPGTFRADVAVDTAQGTPESIRLYYQAHEGGSYELYRDNDHQNGSFPYGEPIMINSVLIGGEGNYSFYSVASGGGVTEPRPSTADASTSVDSTPPKTTISVSGTAAEKGWYGGPATVHLEASDARSGVDHIRYKVDDGAWATWSGDITLEDDGAHTVHYQAADEAGNLEQGGSSSINIDMTAPITVYSVGASGNVIITPTDLASGIESAYFRDDGGEWFIYDPQAQLLEAEGLVEYYAVDRAGNKEVIKTLDLGNVPMSKVALTIKELGTGHPSGEVVRIEWTCDDPSSMVDNFEVLVDGVVVKTLDRSASSFDLEALEDGSYSITVRAVGDGGNSTFRTVAVTIGAASNEADPSGLLLPAIVAVAAVGGLGGFLFAWSRRRSK